MSQRSRGAVSPAFLVYSSLMGINGVENLIPTQEPFAKTFVDCKINTSARADKQIAWCSQPSVKYSCRQKV